MSARYVIDGYNLLYALGISAGCSGPDALEQSRRRLLALLADGFGDECPAATIVFDAAGAPPLARGREEYRGLAVRYAVRHDEADDLIEFLIQHSSTPRQLTVISDDRRLQQAARRRDCTAQGCNEFVAWLARRQRERQRQATPPEKCEGLSAEETQRWLDEFAGLANDPNFKKLFEPYEFER
jgi:predicted RNA-binding protein with PIN domain